MHGVFLFHRRAVLPEWGQKALYRNLKGYAKHSELAPRGGTAAGFCCKLFLPGYIRRAGANNRALSDLDISFVRLTKNRLDKYRFASTLTLHLQP